MEISIIFLNKDGENILKAHNRKRILINITQNLFLFAIAIVLVTGFYYHGEFYKLGWIGLLIIGSITTFITLKAILYLNYNRILKKEFDGFLIFKPEEIDSIKHGQIKQIIRPERDSNIKPGDLYKAKINVMSDQHFSELLIKSVLSKKLKELNEKDIFLTGVKSKSEFKNRWIEKYGGWKQDLEVKMIRFEPIEKMKLSN